MSKHTPGPWRLTSQVVGVAIGHASHHEAIAAGNRVLCEMTGVYATEFVPGQHEFVGGVKREIVMKDFTHDGWPVFTEGEPFPHSANARLIAAAPEMLTALRKAVSMLPVRDPVYAIVRDAIAKAEG